MANGLDVKALREMTAKVAPHDGWGSTLFRWHDELHPALFRNGDSVAYFEGYPLRDAVHALLVAAPALLDAADEGDGLRAKLDNAQAYTDAQRTEIQRLDADLESMTIDRNAGLVRERDAVARAERAERERDDFKRIGQGFERDSRKFFEQSCLNLARAEKAERERDEARAAFGPVQEERIAMSREDVNRELREDRDALRARAEKAEADRDFARKERDDAEEKVGDWTGKKCPACKGTGEREDALACQSCGGTGDEYMNWKPRALAAEARVATLEGALAGIVETENLPVGDERRMMARVRVVGVLAQKERS